MVERGYAKWFVKQIPQTVSSSRIV